MNSRARFTRLLLFAAIVAACIIPLMLLAADPPDGGSGDGGPGLDLTTLVKFIVGLADKNPIVGTIVILIGCLRLLFKPIFLAIEYYAKETPNPDDDVAVLKFEHGPIYRWLSIFLDTFASVKTNSLPKKDGAG